MKLRLRFRCKFQHPDIGLFFINDVIHKIAGLARTQAGHFAITYFNDIRDLARLNVDDRDDAAECINNAATIRQPYRIVGRVGKATNRRSLKE
jgi:hypothetical protein